METASPLRHRDDLDGLFAQLASFAREQRQKYADMMPVGMTLGLDGEGTFAAAHGEDSQEILAMLRTALGRQLSDGTCQAAAIVYDASIGAGGETIDALIFDLEHRDGESVRLFIPYRKGFFGRLKFGAIGRVAAEDRVISGGVEST